MPHAPLGIISFPQAYRTWFDERKFEIDEFTVPISQGPHSAIHTMGWNDEVMKELWKQEKKIGRKLTPSEIMNAERKVMAKFKIDDLEILPYQD